MKDKKLYNPETELLSGKKSLTQNIQCINGKIVKKLSIHIKIYLIPVDFLKKKDVWVKLN